METIFSIWESIIITFAEYLNLEITTSSESCNDTSDNENTLTSVIFDHCVDNL
jgi:hypothetical protein